jgi:hypothetical protein
MASTKRKKKDNTQLLIGLGVGAGILVVLIIGGVVAVIVASKAEEPQVKARPKDPEPPKPVVKVQPEKLKDIGEKTRPSAAGNLRVRIDRIERINELRNIGQFYQQYALNFNRPPASAKDFADYIKTDAQVIKQAIDEKYYFIVPNVKDGNAIVAYEFDPDTQGRHGTVRMGGQGAQEDMTSQELVAALKAQGSQ